MALTAVGSLVTNFGAALSTLAVSPTSRGDCLVLAIQNTVCSAHTPYTSVSGGGVPATGQPGGWANLVYVCSTVAPYSNVELWFGTIATTGSSTITATASSHGGSIGLSAQQFSAGAPATWAGDGSGATLVTSSAATSGNYPSVSPVGSGELYLATAEDTGDSFGGSSSGFVYNATAIFVGYGQFVYNLAASTPTAYTPPWTSGSGLFTGVSGLIVATLVPPASSSGLLSLL